MKVVNIIGGLGNQMFQYGLLVGLRETFGEDIFVDISGFSNYNLHNGLELEQIFPIKLNLTKKELPHIKRLTLSRYVFQYFRFLCKGCQYEYTDFRYNESVYKDDRRDCYYSGYWHNYRYMVPFRVVLQKEFMFVKPLSEKNRFIADGILEEESVGIHIRRGDYLKEKQYQGICEKSYYEEAIRRMRDKYASPKFYIFSNDAQWCVDNLSPFLEDSSSVFVDWNTGKNSYCDMQLMTYCKGLVIANSSFSWWGAFLNKRGHNYVIAPKRWKNTKYNLEIQLPEWELI